jgi:uncharacterized protein YciI
MKMLLSAIVVFAVSLSCFAQDKYTIVFLNKNSEAPQLSKEESSKIMEGHMANMKKLAQEGKLLAAGPFEGGGGLFIMNSTSIDDIKTWIAPDPGVQARRWNVEMLPYKPRYGSICPVKEPYEMIMYSFVRFDAIVSKSTATTFPQIMNKHDQYLKELTKTGNTVTEAIFGEHDGGILIMKGDVTREVFESDPGVQEGLIDLNIKKLYIAKGSFCEQ